MAQGMRKSRRRTTGPAALAPNQGPISLLRTTALMVAAAFGAVTSVSLANPSGAKVVNGSASITNSGSTLVIKNTPGAIINWQSFLIGAGETTNFIQQSVNSAVLNRVVGVDPSVILGTLTSNGHVYLVNPNGVVFGKGAMVDAAGLVVSSLDITDEDFKNGTLRFVGSDASGSISVAGVLRSSDGDVYLIAPNITNSGSITAVNGNVTLAAGQDVEILGNGLTDIQFNVQNKGNSAVNLGQINGDAVGIFAGTITQAGGVNATTATLQGGRVILSALSDVTLAAGSSTSADDAGGSGGSITVHSLGGNISMASGASVSASGASGGSITLLSGGGADSITGSVAASGTLGLGGAVDVLGASVALNSGAAVDASGATGGGQISIGGAPKQSAILNASSTSVAAGAAISANANGSGDGGHVVVYGTSAMSMLGSVSAMGGTAGGNGGLVETSGESIDVQGSVTAAARSAKGKPGEWLLDPNNVTIDNNGAAVNFPTVGSDVSAVSVATALDAGTTVTISTATVPGTVNSAFIAVNAPINATAVQNNASLTLLAGGDINVNAAITGIALIAASGTPLALNMTANLDGSGGAINISAPIYLPRGMLNATAVTFSNIAGNTITASNVKVSTSGDILDLGIVDASAASNGSTGGGQVQFSNSAGNMTLGAITVDALGGSGGRIETSAANNLTLTGNLSVSDDASGTTAPSTQPGIISIGAGGIGTLHNLVPITISANGASTLVGGGNAAGVFFINNGGGSIALSGVTINATGGSALAAGSGAGGSGGSIGFTANSALMLSGISININGGQGAAGVAAVGGNGGSGGHIEFFSEANSTFNNVNVTANGGAAGNGDGATGGNGSFQGGFGGNGGQVSFENFVSTSGLSFSIVNSSFSVNGGAGGNGGTYVGTTDSVQANAGDGGAGGRGGVLQLNGTGGISLAGVSLIANGGQGGLGGMVTGVDTIAVGGTGGAGGSGGNISIQQSDGNISLVASNLQLAGGAGGAAQTSSASVGAGGDGGAGGSSYSGGYPIEIIADNGFVTIDSNSHVTVSGGPGGAGAAGFLTDVATTGYSITGGSGGVGGNASGIQIYGNTSLTMAGTVTIQGGVGGAGGVTGGSNSTMGAGLSSGNGGQGGAIGLNNSALSLSSLGLLNENATIQIIGGAGGAGARAGSANVTPGNGGQGGEVDVITISGQGGVLIGNALSIVSGAGGNTTGNGSFLGTAGSGGLIETLGITAPAGAITITAPISLRSGLPGSASGGGLAGSSGSIEGILVGASGNVVESGSGAFLVNNGALNLNATGFGVNLGGNNQITFIAGVATGSNFITKSVVNLSASAFDVPGMIELIAAGPGSTLELDGSLRTGAGVINLSGGAAIAVLADIDSASAVNLSGGSLSLNGHSVTAASNINISVAGALTPGAGALTASGYYLNAGGSVGSAATPIELTPLGFSNLGGSAGAGFYVDSSGQVNVLAGTGQGIVAGNAIVIDAPSLVNQGTIRGGNITLNQSYISDNLGTIDSGGSLIMTGQFVTSAGSTSGDNIVLSGTSGLFVSGHLAAVGNLALASSGISIGFNSHATTVSAANITINGGSLTVSPDVNSTGAASGGGAPLVSINAAGTLTVTLSGDATLVAGAEQGAYVSIISGGDSTYNIGGSLSLTGGTAKGAYALLDPTKPGSNMNISAQNITLQGGSAPGAYAAIESINNVILNAPNGVITLTDGSGTDADAVVIAGTAGSVTVNAPSCVNCVQRVGPTPIGDGTTESGIYTVMAPAPPLAPPTTEQQALDLFVNNLLTLLILPPTQLQDTSDTDQIEVDGATDGCI